MSIDIMNNQKAMDPFWTDSAADYLSGLILILFNEAKEEINLGSTQLMVSNLNDDKLENVIELNDLNHINKIENLNNYDKYPELDINKNNYFNFNKLI
jgi:hypothetical protein